MKNRNFKFCILLLSFFFLSTVSKGEEVPNYLLMAERGGGTDSVNTIAEMILGMMSVSCMLVMLISLIKRNNRFAQGTSKVNSRHSARR